MSFSFKNNMQRSSKSENIRNRYENISLIMDLPFVY